MERSKWARWSLVGVVMAVLGLSLAACGDSDDNSAGASQGNASTASSDGYSYDTSDDGDDLLAAEVRRFTFGKDVAVTWRFPEFYADGEADETSTLVERDAILFTTMVAAGGGTTPRATAEELADRTGAEAIHDVKLGGRDWVVVVNESAAGSSIAFYGALPGGVVIGATFTADVPLTEVAPERITELHQTVLSIQPDISG